MPSGQWGQGHRDASKGEARPDPDFKIDKIVQVFDKTGLVWL
jgi:hypothetical protein